MSRPTPHFPPAPILRPMTSTGPRRRKPTPASGTPGTPESPKRNSTSASSSNAALVSELHIREFSWDEVTRPPVAVVHAPRGAGMTTLLGSLIMQAQAKLGIEGAVVLCDRPEANYMGKIMPADIIYNKPPDKVLSELISMQSHRASLEADVHKQRLMFVMDDVLYSPRMLQSHSFQVDIKRAKDFDIMIIIATSNANVLPTNLHTFATHVFATRCVSTSEPAALQKRMFVMFNKAADLVKHLVLLRPYQFLVGLVRPATGAGVPSLPDFVRFYTPTVYSNGERIVLPRELDAGWGTSSASVDGGSAVDDDDAASARANDGDATDADTENGSAASVRLSVTQPPRPTPVIARFRMHHDLIAHVAATVSKIE